MRKTLLATFLYHFCFSLSVRFNFYSSVAADRAAEREKEKELQEKRCENSLQFLSLRHFNYWRGAKPGTISGKIYRDKKPKTLHTQKEQRE